MLGEGIVSFGVARETWSFRNVKASPKIVCSSETRSPMCIDGGANSMSPCSLWNATFSELSITLLTPPSW